MIVTRTRNLNRYLMVGRDDDQRTGSEGQETIEVRLEENLSRKPEEGKKK